MQTLTISRTGGRSNYTLSPTRNTGELQDKLAKCNGKSRKNAIRDTRTKGNFPKLKAGMSTADYVRLFESLGTPCKPVEWAQLNSEPCTLYSGADTCETLPDGFDTWEDFDAAQGSSTAAESAPADAEPVDAAEPVAPDDAIAPAIVASAEPYPGCEPAAAIVYRVHLATAAHSRAIDPAFNGYRRPRSACMLADFAAPAVRAHRLAIARSVRAERAKRASLEGSEPQRMADAMRARIAPTADALREAAAELEARAARVPSERADDYRGAAAMLRADADAAPGIVPGFASRGARMLQAAIARSAARGIEVGTCGAPPATHSALVAEINAMSPVDAFDYLADYTTAGERHMTDAEKAPDAMRAAVLADVERTGEAVFWARRRGEPDDDGPTTSPPATHSEPAPARPVYANDHLAWLDVENGRAEPDEYQARVIECFGEVKAGGLFYNSDTYPAAAALMTARYGYPDWRGDRGQHDGVMNPFGMDCYRADSVIRARAERERERGAAATFTVGQRFARLIFNDGKQRTAAELVTLDPAGFACKLKAKSGRNSVEITCSAYALSLAVIRAEERGKVLAAKRASARPEPVDPLPTQSDSVPVPGKLDAAPDRIEPDIFIRRATSAERMGNAPRQRAMRSLVPMAGHTVMFKPYGHKGAGFYWVLDRRADTLPSESDNAAPIECEPVPDVAAEVAEPIAPMPAEPAPVPGKSEPETLMLSHVLGALQCIAPDGIPDAAMLAREADRIEATAERMRDAMPAYSATCATVARDLRALADSTSDPLPGDTKPEALDDDETIPAPLDGLDVAELGDDGMAEFEQATREQATAPAYRELTTAHYRPQGPCLRIPAYDARAMIPQRFAPVYLLQF